MLCNLMLSVLSPKKFGVRRIPRLGTGRLRNEIGHVTHQSIGNFTWSKKKYTFGGQKCENRPSEPKNGIWGPKSVWSCDISIDREFYIEQEKMYFWGSKT
jgi:hypothetical protein